MAKLSASITRLIVAAVVAVIVVAAGAYFLLGGSSDRKLTARFTSAVGVYTGTPVRILGVNVGQVTAVHPKGDYVEVVIAYDSTYKLPDNVSAVEVANSLVSDRYIQLTPAWHTARASHTQLRDNATIGINRTGGPAELDDIYAALDKLSVALGPTGANTGGKQNGALSQLIRVGAANLKGNGTALGESITNLSRAAQTLANHRGDLFGTVRNLEKFTRTLKNSDAEVRKFNQLLAQVAGDLASERTDFGAALHDLGLMLDDVATFVRSNASKFHRDIVGLEKLTGLLVRERASLNETLAVAPYALSNIVHSYQPDLGALATRGNLLSLQKIDVTSVVCGLLGTATGGLAGVLKNLPGGLGTTVGNLCKGKTGTNSQSSAPLTGTGAPGLVGGGAK